VTCGLQVDASIRVGAERGYGRASAQTIRRTANNVLEEHPARRAGGS